MFWTRNLFVHRRSGKLSNTQRWSLDELPLFHASRAPLLIRQIRHVKPLANYTDSKVASTISIYFDNDSITYSMVMSGHSSILGIVGATLAQHTS